MKYSLIVLVSACIPFLATATRAGDIRTVAVQNQASPGGPVNSRFQLFGTFFGAADLSVNSSGQTAFPASMNPFFGGVTTSNDSGIWSEGGGSLNLLAREGDQAPDTPLGAVFNNFDGQLVLNDPGQVAFTGFLRTGAGGVVSTNDSGIWSGGIGAVSLVARAGDAAPDAGGGVFAAFQNPSIGLVLNDVGQAAFYGRLFNGTAGVTTSNDTGIWSQGQGGLHLVAREGVDAPGTPSGAVFDAFTGGGRGTSLNNLGQVAFRGFLRTGTGGVTTSNDAGIWSDVGGTTALVMREGDDAPGTPSGVKFDGFGEPPALNDSGHLLIRGFLRQGPGGVTADTDDGLWSNRGGSLALVARGGDQSPDAPPGAKLESFTNYVLNNAGKVAFYGNMLSGSGGVDATNDTAFWSEGHGALKLVAREGSPAPETPAGAVFDSFGGRPTLNDDGQLAFYGTLRAGFGGVTTANDTGIWAEDPQGILRLIVREGDSIEVSPGNLKTVTGLRFISVSGNADGQRSQFGDGGHVAFWADLAGSDGEGLFVSNKLSRFQIPGDFTGNGVVDGSDYVVWRNELGQTYSAEHYGVWREHFGETSGNGSGVDATSAVPEPGSLALLLAGLIALSISPRASVS